MSASSSHVPEVTWDRMLPCDFSDFSVAFGGRLLLLDLSVREGSSGAIAAGAVVLPACNVR